MVRARFGVAGGQCLSSVAAGRLCDRLRMLVRALALGDSSGQTSKTGLTVKSRMPQDKRPQKTNCLLCGGCWPIAISSPNRPAPLN